MVPCPEIIRNQTHVTCVQKLCRKRKHTQSDCHIIEVQRACFQLRDAGKHHVGVLLCNDQIRDERVQPVHKLSLSVQYIRKTADTSIQGTTSNIRHSPQNIEHEVAHVFNSSKE